MIISPKIVSEGWRIPSGGRQHIKQNLLTFTQFLLSITVTFGIFKRYVLRPKLFWRHHQIYTTYSMVTNLLVNIAVGILILLILSVVVITIMSGLETTTAEPKQLSIDKENNTLKQDEDAFSIQLNHALVLKLLISCEGLTYIVVNLKMLRNWVSGWW